VDEFACFCPCEMSFPRCVQLVMYLIENKMSSLSGRPQKIVVNILEEIVSQGTLQPANTCII